MGNPRGVRRDFKALEARRFAAVRLLRAGRSQAVVARELGVHRQSVYRWQLTLADEGRAGLRHGGRAGRPPKLTGADLRVIERALKAGPEAYGYATGLWTLPRVATLIAQLCGVTYHPAHVGRLLRRLGWSCQRPTGRALERNEAAIREWKQVRWPQVKKTPRAGARR